MKKKYEKKMVYRVWDGKSIEKEAFFTEKEAAEGFAKLAELAKSKVA